MHTSESALEYGQGLGTTLGVKSLLLLWVSGTELGAQAWEAGPCHWFSSDVPNSSGMRPAKVPGPIQNPVASFCSKRIRLWQQRSKLKTSLQARGHYPTVNLMQYQPTLQTFQDRFPWGRDRAASTNLMPLCLPAQKWAALSQALECLDMASNLHRSLWRLKE